ncbi:MAG: tRNA (guanosine(37)-N1)-methyltransferase TrmD [Armatimonadetes bacterium]|nr:tRNA (guanosine(37)-N1)-methyltransferase TrmD [Armatimonadota bacterium]
MVLDALSHSIMARARQAAIAEFHAVNPRDFATDKHRTVDSEPYGGGPGMVMMAPPIAAALDSIRADRGSMPVVLMDPAAPLFGQADAAALSASDRVALVCGHYEGLDERVRTCLCSHAYSVGDFVVTGGEFPALMVADAIVRLIPGAIGDPASHEDDSHQHGLLGHPLYTRPESFMDEEVPAVLKSGHHGNIASWRRRESLRRTRDTRPDLFAQADLKPGDLDLL